MENTDCVGTCRKNKKSFPKEVVQKKLKRGKTHSLQRSDGILVMKWKDKREILMLSTFHDNSMVDTKPQVVLDYIKAKLFVDTSDQIAVYYPFVRRTTKWYLRLTFYIITQTCLINAWRLYHDKFGTISFLDFKQSVMKSLIEHNKPPTPISKHFLEKSGPAKTTSKRCTNCYKNNKAEYGSDFARKKTKKCNTRCNYCQNHFCLDCFNSKHRKCDGFTE